MCKNKDLLFKEHTTVSTTSWCFWQESQKEQIGSAKLHSALTVWLRCCGGYDRCWNSTSSLSKMHQTQSWSSTFPPLKMICSLWGVRMLGWWLYMYREERGGGGKGRLRQGGKKIALKWWSAQQYQTNVWNWKHAVCLSWNYSEMNHSLGTGGFGDSSSEQRTDKQLYSMCIYKNKKENTQRRRGADVWQLIPSSDIYLPVTLFSNLLSTPCACWFYLLCSVFLRSKTNGKGGIQVTYQRIWYTGQACAVLMLRWQHFRTSA